MDMLASRFNAKLDTFISRTRNPKAIEVDSLVTPCDLCLLYSVASFMSTQQDSSRSNAPTWLTWAWCPDIVKMLVDSPLILLVHPNLLSKGTIFHPSLKTKS